MGVYHFGGIGRSIGAVTAPLSYLSARKLNLAGNEIDPLFKLSGELGEDHETRGSVEALVLFTSEEIYNGEIRSLAYTVNQPGNQPRRADETPVSISKLLNKHAPKALENLSRQTADGSTKKLLVYWCLHDWKDPLQTFKRVYQVMQATKAADSGKVGKEIWVNLTGGSNIVNSALQLSASLSGVPAKMYYVIADDGGTNCIYHTLPNKQIGTDNDRYWIDMPLTFLDFDPVKENILRILPPSEYVQGGSIMLDDLYESVRNIVNEKLVSELKSVSSKDVFINRDIRPLIGQGLIIDEPLHRMHYYRKSEAAVQMQPYLKLVSDINNQKIGSLTELRKTLKEQNQDWLKLDHIDLDPQ